MIRPNKQIVYSSLTIYIKNTSTLKALIFGSLKTNCLFGLFAESMGVGGGGGVCVLDNDNTYPHNRWNIRRANVLLNFVSV